MFWVAMESFRKSRGATLVEFSEMLGRSKHSYQYLRTKRVISYEKRMELMESGIFTDDEIWAAKESMSIDSTNAEEVREFKEMLLAIGEDSKRSRSSSSEFRIKNIPDFYEKLKALEDTTQFSMLREVDPNDLRLQEIRSMIGEKAVWENPPPVSEEALYDNTMVADRRNEVDQDIRYSCRFNL